jgi:hypothetical protein
MQLGFELLSKKVILKFLFGVDVQVDLKQVDSNEGWSVKLTWSYFNQQKKFQNWHSYETFVCAGIWTLDLQFCHANNLAASLKMWAWVL